MRQQGRLSSERERPSPGCVRFNQLQCSATAIHRSDIAILQAKDDTAFVDRFRRAHMELICAVALFMVGLAMYLLGEA